MAADIAGTWRNGGSVLAQGTQEAARAGEASLAGWPDAAGEQFHGRVRGFSADTDQLQQKVADRARHAEYYRNELTSAKNAIVHTIAQSEKGYADAGLAGPALQNAFAAQDPFLHCANYVRSVPQDERVITSIQSGPGTF